MNSVTVITSSIGRPELRQAIESVRSQSYTGVVRHHVYVNGPRFHEAARAILRDYPDVHAVYLPEETGDYGYGTKDEPRGSMADVFAAAPYLTRSDWVFFLDDDNFYEPDHIESIMSFAQANELTWAYSLRRLVDHAGEYICDDDWCSLGAYLPRLGTEGTRIIDNSCFAVSRRLAQLNALAWTALPIVADRCFQMALTEGKHRGRHGCTGRPTVNYRLGTGSANATREQVLEMAQAARADYPNGFPWRKPEIFNPCA